jgi:hypothetical protein
MLVAAKELFKKGAPLLMSTCKAQLLLLLVWLAFCTFGSKTMAKFYGPLPVTTNIICI